MLEHARVTDRGRMAEQDVAPEPLAHPYRWWPAQDGEYPVRSSGSLPSWLVGDLLRTGPARFAEGSWAARHWFDGLSLLYAFELGPKPRFRQRLLQSEQLARIRRGQLSTAMFDTAMSRDLLRRCFAPVPHVTDNCNVNVIPWQGRWLAMTESPHQHVVEGATLNTLGHYRYRDDLPSGMVMTAHPHYDFKRDALVNVGYSLSAQSELLVYRQDRLSNTRKVEGRLRVSRVPYIHSFGLSSRHAVIVAQPFTVLPLTLLWSERGFIEHFKWRPAQGTTLWKLERESGHFERYECDAFFCFHVVNQFEDGRDLVLDMLAYDDPSAIPEQRVERLRRVPAETRARLVRARMRPHTRHVTLESLSEPHLEFPQISYRQQNGRAYDTLWATSLRGQSQPRSELLRIELTSGRVLRHHEPHMTYGEAVFVARPGAEHAEDGVLLAVGTHQSETRSELVVLDARTMERLATLHVELTLPLTLHGSFAFARAE